MKRRREKCDRGDANGRECAERAPARARTGRGPYRAARRRGSGETRRAPQGGAEPRRGTHSVRRNTAKDPHRGGAVGRRRGGRHAAAREPGAQSPSGRQAPQSAKIRVRHACRFDVWFPGPHPAAVRGRRDPAAGSRPGRSEPRAGRARRGPVCPRRIASPTGRGPPPRDRQTRGPPRPFRAAGGVRAGAIPPATPGDWQKLQIVPQKTDSNRRLMVAWHGFGPAFGRLLAKPDPRIGRRGRFWTRFWQSPARMAQNRVKTGACAAPAASCMSVRRLS